MEELGISNRRLGVTTCTRYIDAALQAKREKIGMDDTGQENICIKDEDEISQLL